MAQILNKAKKPKTAGSKLSQVGFLHSVQLLSRPVLQRDAPPAVQNLHTLVRLSGAIKRFPLTGDKRQTCCLFHKPTLYNYFLFYNQLTQMINLK